MPTFPFAEAYGRVLQNQQQAQIIQQNQELLNARRQEAQTDAQINRMLAEQPTRPLSAQAQSEIQMEDTAAQLTSELQTANKFIETGTKVISLDPAKGTDLIEKGQKIRQQAYITQAKLVEEQKDILDHVSQWSGMVNDQSSLEQAREMVEQRQPGTWKQMKLPDTFNETTAPVFNRLYRSTQSAKEQLEIQKKQIEADYEKDYQQARIEEIRSRIAKNKQDSARTRDGLPKTTAAKNPHEIYLNAVEKEELAYTKEVQKVKLDTKKYPEKAQEEGKLWWKVEKPSKQAAALSVLEEEHNKRLDAIKVRAERAGVLVSDEPTTSDVSDDDLIRKYSK